MRTRQVVNAHQRVRHSRRRGCEASDLLTVERLRWSWKTNKPRLETDVRSQFPRSIKEGRRKPVVHFAQLRTNCCNKSTWPLARPESFPLKDEKRDETYCTPTDTVIETVRATCLVEAVGVGCTKPVVPTPIVGVHAASAIGSTTVVVPSTSLD